ncbi:ATP-binding protein [Ottowia testudinis]|uniref:histidine kinase n=1 Tax=Ottowia testudinis TaxID=2816950 RepID=A0A975CG88_9BURK|nr:ATP-binding protein [Ottowia testudinis]QTD45640.1 HAMP domain-containing protein [Ottowia testudinis]
MRPLSRQLFRLAARAALATLLVTGACIWIGLELINQYGERLLSPAAHAAMDKGGELPPAIEAELRQAEKTVTPIMTGGFLACVALGLAVGGLVGWRYARRLVSPLAQLAHTARRLRLGELDARVPAGLTEVQEFDEFIRDFNRMAQGLQAAELERQASSAAIAHELRTPLTVLHGRLNGMLDGVFPLSREALVPLLAQTQLLARIVDDLRLLTLANAGALALNLTATDLARQAQAVLTSMQPLAEAKGWSMQSDLQPAVARADGERVRQALQALIDNALRYGAGPLAVHTRTQGDVVQLRVLDRGPGLPPGAETRAFERFWRADDSRGRESGGSGLGLSVVQAIAQAHGGTAFYEPREGGGAVFGLSLPVSGPPQAAPR